VGSLFLIFGYFLEDAKIRQFLVEFFHINKHMPMTQTVPLTDAIPEFGIARENEERRDGGCGIVYDPHTKKFAVGKQHGNGSLRLFSGGVDAGEDIEEGILREVTEESGLHDFLLVENIGSAMTHYHNTLRNVNRVAKATCLLIVLKSADIIPVELEEHEKFGLAWATADEVLSDFEARNGNKDNDHWVYFWKKGMARLAELGYEA
jgi:ADP-ribose pyrophosphatase YjhB (NUDIX family)